MSKTLNKRILVVDDEADVREYLKAALEDAGFEVETACDGLEALEKIRLNPPDLISLDLVMPKHSGVKCYRELQKDKTLSKIPVLTVTGHARDELGKADFEEMTMSGPGVYLEKPVSSQKYVSAVRKLLGMEPLETSEKKGDDLQKTLAEALKGADTKALQRALEALKKK
jgi:two-component system alkaline phosphatase synthesis response regulator PhoP